MSKKGLSFYFAYFLILINLKFSILVRYAWKPQDTAGLHRKTAGHINDNRKNDF